MPIDFKTMNAEIFYNLANQSKDCRLEWLKGNFPNAMNFLSMVNEMEVRDREGKHESS